MHSLVPTTDKLPINEAVANAALESVVPLNMLAYVTSPRFAELSIEYWHGTSPSFQVSSYCTITPRNMCIYIYIIYTADLRSTISALVQH